MSAYQDAFELVEIFAISETVKRQKILLQNP